MGWGPHCSFGALIEHLLCAGPCAGGTVMCETCKVPFSRFSLVFYRRCLLVFCWFPFPLTPGCDLEEASGTWGAISGGNTCSPPGVFRSDGNIPRPWYKLEDT